MSRMATNEYIGAKRSVYAEADRAKRSRSYSVGAAFFNDVFGL